MENKKDIELRSERVRKIIGQLPPALIRFGMEIITGIIVFLLIVAFFVPYPNTVDGGIILLNVSPVEVVVEAKLPYAYISQIKIGMEGKVELEGYSGKDYGFLHSSVCSISPKVITIDRYNYFSVNLKLDYVPVMQKGMKGKVSILLSRTTLLEYMIYR